MLFINRSHILDQNDFTIGGTTISRTFHNGSCGTSVVGVSAENICGLQSEQSADVTARNAERNTLLGALLYEFCDSGAVTESRK